MRAGAPLSQPASVSRLGHPLRTTSVTSASRSSFQSHSSGITSISTTCSSRHRHTITTSGATTSGATTEWELGRGDAILFSSRTVHNITELTSGTRNSMVIEWWDSARNVHDRDS